MLKPAFRHNISQFYIQIKKPMLLTEFFSVVEQFFLQVGLTDTIFLLLCGWLNYLEDMKLHAVPFKLIYLIG